MDASPARGLSSQGRNRFGSHTCLLHICSKRPHRQFCQGLQLDDRQHSFLNPFCPSVIYCPFCPPAAIGCQETEKSQCQSFAGFGKLLGTSQSRLQTSPRRWCASSHLWVGRAPVSVLNKISGNDAPNLQSFLLPVLEGVSRRSRYP